MRNAPKRLTVDRFLEHLGLVLAAPARQVLAGVVDEHVERVEAPRRPPRSRPARSYGTAGTRTPRGRRRSRRRRRRVPVTVTRAPAAWNARAIARPMPDVPPVTSTRAPAKSNVAPVHAHTFSQRIDRRRSVHREREAQLAERVLGGRRGRRSVQHGVGEVGELGLVRTQVAALLAHLRALPVGAVPAASPSPSPRP